MADINHLITLGIGTPGDIPHFIWWGLNASVAAVGHETRIVGLDAFQSAAAGLDAFVTGAAGLDAFGSGAAGLDVFADADAGLDDVR